MSQETKPRPDFYHHESTSRAGLPSTSEEVTKNIILALRASRTTQGAQPMTSEPVVLARRRYTYSKVGDAATMVNLDLQEK